MADRQFEPRVVDATSLSEGEAVLVAQEYLRFRQWQLACVLCRSWIAIHGASPSVAVCLGAAYFAAGDRPSALSLFGEVLAVHPSHLMLALYRAQMLFNGGGALERAQAVSELRRIVEREPELPGAQGALSAALFPGPPYRRVLEGIHRLLRPRTYLEIGVESGASLTLAAGADVAVGVDPVRALQVPLPSNAQFFEEPSNEFFSSQTRRGVFGDRELDFAFIDGLHLFEQVLRDFCNVERWSHPNTVIVLHDCLPTNLRVATRERQTTFWTGDTWKVLEVLRTVRPDLLLAVIPTPPSGLLVIRGLDARSTVLDGEFPQLVSQWMDAPYPYEPGNWPAEFNLVSNDEMGIQRSLGL